MIEKQRLDDRGMLLRWEKKNISTHKILFSFPTIFQSYFDSFKYIVWLILARSSRCIRYEGGRTFIWTTKRWRKPCTNRCQNVCAFLSFFWRVKPAFTPYCISLGGNRGKMLAHKEEEGQSNLLDERLLDGGCEEVFCFCFCFVC